MSGPTFHLVTQVEPNDCARAVCAMITGRSLAEVTRETRTTPGGLRFSEVAGYLNRYGWHVGGYGSGVGRFIFWRRNNPSWLLVRNQSRTGWHSVLWDGHQVLDPEPANAGRKLREYAVAENWPLLKWVTDREAGDVGEADYHL